MIVDIEIKKVIIKGFILGVIMIVWENVVGLTYAHYVICSRVKEYAELTEYAIKILER